MSLQASRAKRSAVARRGSVITSGAFSLISASSALVCHFCDSAPGANNTRGLLQRLCRELAHVVLSDYSLATTPLQEVMLSIRRGMGSALSAGAVAERAVEWVCGVGTDGSVIGMAGKPCPPGSFKELRRLLFGLLLVVCATRRLYLLLDAVDVLRGGDVDAAGASRP